MKKQTFKRIAAAIAACVMLGAAIPAATIPASAANLVSNSTFESGSSGWGMYKESGGAATLGTDSGRLALHVSSTGELTYSVQMSYANVPLYQNAKYRLSYDISCTTNRYVECMLQQNGGTYQAYDWEGLTIGQNATHVDKTFTMKADTDIMAKLVFNCGLEEADGGPLPEHTIYLDNVVVEVVDDSQVNYEATGPYMAPIVTDQVGYRPDAKKTVVVRGANGASKFSVVNAASGQTVYTGDLGAAINNNSAKESDQIGDFSSVTAEGKYYITCGNLDKSYTFTIGSKVYDDMLDESVKMLYLQRCGCAVEGGKFSHPACHNTQATVYGTGQKIDVSGGWHDAGDYGRYVVPAAKAVADLMYAYLGSPSSYGDNIGIPESGNGKADILDEAKYELDWMMKMQASNGGVYHKVTCANFPGYVAPQAETKELIVTPISTTATADFAASMALAAEVYKSYDKSYADKCLAAAEKAWSFLEQNPNFIFQNPGDITTGEYGDKTDADERYWAAAQLYRTTGNSKYLSSMSSAKTGLDWSTVGDYGNIALLTAPSIDKSSTAYQNAKNAVLKQADTFLGNSNSSPYGVALTKFEWGSNMTVANAGIILGLASQLTGESKYADAAEAQLHYLLGENPLGTCFMTGYGTVSPENPHHRPSMVAGEAMKGMLVGGVNSNLEDDAAKAYLRDTAPAKCYVDNSESYSTNEITIYWNSPLTYLITLTDAEAAVEQPTEAPTQAPTEAPTQAPTEAPTQAPTQGQDPTGVVYGDCDVDGDVDIMDVIAINKSLLGSLSLSAQGKTNADVDRNTAIDTTDALNILKAVVKLVTLPVGDAPQQPVEQPTQAPTEAPTQAPNHQDTPSGIKDYGTAMNANATSVEDFRDGSSSMFIASDGWTNGDCFNCWWYKENTSLDNGCLTLTIDQDRAGKGMYSGAEYRTNDFYGFGYYETSMQAIKNPGVVSSFFTYTGPSDNNPWDEVDIEILGKDTTKVQLNYYKNGQGRHEFMYDLGFDASEGYHTYGFDWQADHITWYVDGKAVHTMYGDMPVTPGKIMMNTWPGITVDEWLQPFNGKTPLSAHYQWVTYNKQ